MARQVNLQKASKAVGIPRKLSVTKGVAKVTKPINKRHSTPSSKSQFKEGETAGPTIEIYSGRHQAAVQNDVFQRARLLYYKEELQSAFPHVNYPIPETCPTTRAASLRIRRELSTPGHTTDGTRQEDIEAWISPALRVDRQDKYNARRNELREARSIFSRLFRRTRYPLRKALPEIPESKAAQLARQARHSKPAAEKKTHKSVSTKINGGPPNSIPDASQKGWANSPLIQKKGAISRHGLKGGGQIVSRIVGSGNENGATSIEVGDGDEDEAVSDNACDETEDVTTSTENGDGDEDEAVSDESCDETEAVATSVEFDHDYGVVINEAGDPGEYAETDHDDGAESDEANGQQHQEESEDEEVRRTSTELFASPVKPRSSPFNGPHPTSNGSSAGNSNQENQPPAAPQEQRLRSQSPEPVQPITEQQRAAARVRLEEMFHRRQEIQQGLRDEDPDMTESWGVFFALRETYTTQQMRHLWGIFRLWALDHPELKFNPQETPALIPRSARQFARNHAPDWNAMNLHNVHIGEYPVFGPDYPGQGTEERVNQAVDVAGEAEDLVELARNVVEHRYEPRPLGDGPQAGPRPERPTSAEQRRFDSESPISGSDLSVESRKAFDFEPSHLQVSVRPWTYIASGPLDFGEDVFVPDPQNFPRYKLNPTFDEEVLEYISQLREAEPIRPTVTVFAPRGWTISLNGNPAQYFPGLPRPSNPGSGGDDDDDEPPPFGSEENELSKNGRRTQRDDSDSPTDSDGDDNDDKQPGFDIFVDSEDRSQSSKHGSGKPRSRSGTPKHPARQGHDQGPDEDRSWATSRAATRPRSRSQSAPRSKSASHSRSASHQRSGQGAHGYSARSTSGSRPASGSRAASRPRSSSHQEIVGSRPRSLSPIWYGAWDTSKVVDLKIELKKRGIAQTGLRTKQQMMDRLKHDDQERGRPKENSKVEDEAVEPSEPEEQPVTRGYNLRNYKSSKRVSFDLPKASAPKSPLKRKAPDTESPTKPDKRRKTAKGKGDTSYRPRAETISDDEYDLPRLPSQAKFRTKGDSTYRPGKNGSTSEGEDRLFPGSPPSGETPTTTFEWKGKKAVGRIGQKKMAKASRSVTPYGRRYESPRAHTDSLEAETQQMSPGPTYRRRIQSESPYSNAYPDGRDRRRRPKPDMKVGPFASDIRGRSPRRNHSRRAKQQHMLQWRQKYYNRANPPARAKDDPRSDVARGSVFESIEDPGPPPVHYGDDWENWPKSFVSSSSEKSEGDQEGSPDYGPPADLLQEREREEREKADRDRSPDYRPSPDAIEEKILSEERQRRRRRGHSRR